MLAAYEVNQLQQGVEHLSPVVLDLKYFASVFYEQIVGGIYVIASKIVGKKALICNLQLSKKDNTTIHLFAHSANI